MRGDTYYANQYCRKHYEQFKRCGRVLRRTVHDPNEIVDCGNHYEICLYDIRCNEIARAKIDKEDLEKVKKHKWSLNSCGYVKAKINKISVSLHHLILRKKNKLEIDHIHHDKLDNRKKKLRHCTHSQNLMNNIGKGYYWDKSKRRWKSYISVKQKQIHLGSFAKKQDAIDSRRQAEKKYFKEFAYN